MFESITRKPADSDRSMRKIKSDIFSKTILMHDRGKDIEKYCGKEAEKNKN